MMGSFMENYNNMSFDDKLVTLELEIGREELLLGMMSNPMKIRMREKYIKSLKSMRKQLKNKQK